jgi:protein-disulfide isomerase
MHGIASKENRMPMRNATFFSAVILLAGMFGSRSAQAQFAGTPAQDSFRDTSILKPAPGTKVSVIVFEDLGCPACAHAHPIELDATQKYHVPLLRHDFPIPAHIWTFDGAVCARYLQDKVSPKLAEEYRSAVFASQMSIGSKDDLQHFTQRWMQQHGQQMPFVMDPNGDLAAKVRADFNLGMKLNVQFTPTVVVVTDKHYQVVCGGKQGGPSDPNQLYPVIAAALEQTKTTRP